MTQQIINVGAAPNDGDGDPIRTAFIKTNDNFTELYARVQVTPPSNAIGKSGDEIGYYSPTADYLYYCFANYDGSNVIWAQIQSSGNITATKIQNGTSVVEILDTNGNANVSINGTSNVAVFANTGVYVSRLSAIGNISTGNYIFGNGAFLSGLPATYSNANVADFLPVYSGNIAAAYTSVSGNIIGGNISTLGQISAQGTINASGNIVTTGYFIGTFAGNVTGNFVVPGSNTQVIFNTNGNADAVGGMTYNKGSNTFSVLGVISAQSNVVGGNLLTGGIISATSTITSAANIAGANIIASSSVSAASGINSGTTIIATGNIRGGNLISNGLITATGDVTAANINGANILASGLISASANIYSNATVHVTNDINVGGNISATGYTGTFLSVIGNITGSYIFGNGACLTGIITSVSNIVNGTSNIGIPSTDGNVIVSVGGQFNTVAFTSSGIQNHGYISASGNVTAGNILTAGLISLTGNIYVGNVINTGSSSLAGNITAGNISTLGLISLAGNIYAGNVINTGSSSLAGNITAGNIISTGSSSLTGNITAGNVLTSGLISTSGNINTNILSASGNITAGNVLTSGLISTSGNINTNILSASGNITAGNLSVGTGTITVNNIVNSGSNATGNIGSSSTYFNTVFATASTALYADLSECYLGDAYYTPGTVVSFGGPNEVTFCDVDQDPTVAGVVSTQPAYQMNTGLTGEYVTIVALLGRVPCMVQGPVAKGSLMVSAGNGRAKAQVNPLTGTVIGKALESFDGDVGTIEIVVGRV